MQISPENLIGQGKQTLFAEAERHLQQCFGNSQAQTRAFFAPGRVNLIGEHIDYNGGLVFPCAVNHGVTLAIRPSPANDGNKEAAPAPRIRLASVNFPQQLELELSPEIEKQGEQWVNYPLAVIDQLQKAGKALGGFDACFFGDLPDGAGLSSSAAVEMVTAFALNELFGCSLDRLALVKLCQAAENEFIGVACGVLDQFAVAMAEPQHAMRLDCSTLAYQQVPVITHDNVFVIADTGQSRELAAGGYNERVKECQRALERVQKHHNIHALAELSSTDLEALHDEFSADPIALARARHVCSEQQRVAEATRALNDGQLQTFGELMNQSHASLRDNYSVSSEPLEHMISAALDQDSTLGCRLTGAGFGGCTVNLIARAHRDQWIEQVAKTYKASTAEKYSPSFYVFEPAAGVAEFVPVQG